MRRCSPDDVARSGYGRMEMSRGGRTTQDVNNGLWITANDVWIEVIPIRNCASSAPQSYTRSGGWAAGAVVDNILRLRSRLSTSPNKNHGVRCSLLRYAAPAAWLSYPKRGEDGAVFSDTMRSYLLARIQLAPGVELTAPHSQPTTVDQSSQLIFRHPEHLAAVFMSTPSFILLDSAVSSAILLN